MVGCGEHELAQTRSRASPGGPTSRLSACPSRVLEDFLPHPPPCHTPLPSVSGPSFCRPVLSRIPWPLTSQSPGWKQSLSAVGVTPASCPPTSGVPQAPEARSPLRSVHTAFEGERPSGISSPVHPPRHPPRHSWLSPGEETELWLWREWCCEALTP